RESFNLIESKAYGHPSRALVFGPSARAAGRQPIVGAEELKTGDSIQPGFGETKLADGDRSVGRNQENAGHEFQTIVRRHRVRIFVDQNRELQSVALRELARLIGFVLRDRPECQSVGTLLKNFLNVRKSELTGRTFRFIEDEGNGPVLKSVGQRMGCAVGVLEF